MPNENAGAQPGDRLGALDLARSATLADERRRSHRDTHGWHENKVQNVEANAVCGDGYRPEAGNEKRQDRQPKRVCCLFDRGWETKEKRAFEEWQIGTEVSQREMDAEAART